MGEYRRCGPAVSKWAGQRPTPGVHATGDTLRFVPPEPSPDSAVLGPRAPDWGVFGPGEVDEAAAFFTANGWATLRGLLSDRAVTAMTDECATAQRQLVAGELDARHGTVILVDDPDGTRTAAFANYVVHVDDLSPTVSGFMASPVLDTFVSRVLGPAWWSDLERFGVVFQDARTSAASSYSRIGWHTDWQSGPNLDIWPSVAFTVHLDATSPDNGFLRVVPGSHRWATPAPYVNVNGAVVPEGSRSALGHTATPPPQPMPLRFEKVPNEIALYAERGDVLFHDAYLWHAAARATSDESVRRHVRGSFYAGTPMGDDARYDEFVKNAAR